MLPGPPWDGENQEPVRAGRGLQLQDAIQSSSRRCSGLLSWVPGPCRSSSRGVLCQCRGPGTSPITCGPLGWHWQEADGNQSSWDSN